MLNSKTMQDRFRIQEFLLVLNPPFQAAYCATSAPNLRHHSFFSPGQVAATQHSMHALRNQHPYRARPAYPAVDKDRHLIPFLISLRWYSVGIKWEAFADDQLVKPSQFHWQLYRRGLVILYGRVLCVLPVQGEVQHHDSRCRRPQDVKREDEVSRKILAFSVSCVHTVGRDLIMATSR